MNKKPLVSVLIAVYNSEKYIEETISSILSQTYEELEIIIIDDGSTDKTLDKVLKFNDKRIQLYKNDKNMGIPYSRNKGLQLAKGEYIAIIDADDIAVDTRIEKQVNHLKRYQDIDVLGTFYKTLGNRLPRIIKTPFIKPNEIKCYLMFYNNIANPTVMLRKEFLDNNKIKFNERFFVAQDYEMWSQVIKQGNIAILPEALTCYRVGHFNITKSSKEGKTVARKKLIDEIHESLMIHFGFKLTKSEIETFNIIFNDNLSKEHFVGKDCFINLILKLLEENKKNKMFEQDLFKTVMSEAVYIYLKKSNLTLNQKLNNIKKMSKILNEFDNYLKVKIIISSLIKKIKK